MIVRLLSFDLQTKSILSFDLQTKSILLSFDLQTKSILTHFCSNEFKCHPGACIRILQSLILILDIKKCLCNKTSDSHQLFSFFNF